MKFIEVSFAHRFARLIIGRADAPQEHNFEIRERGELSVSHRQLSDLNISADFQRFFGP